MRLAGTWTRYSNSAIPQLANAATYNWRSFRFLKWAYHANVMNTLDNPSNSVVCRITGIHGPLPCSENPPIPLCQRGVISPPDDHFNRDREKGNAEDPLQHGAGETGGDLRAEQSPEEKPDAEHRGHAQIDVALLEVHPRGQDADRRDHHRQRRTLGQVLRKPEQEHQDRHDDDPPAAPDQPA